MAPIERFQPRQRSSSHKGNATGSCTWQVSYIVPLSHVYYCSTTCTTTPTISYLLHLFNYKYFFRLQSFFHLLRQRDLSTLN